MVNIKSQNQLFSRQIFFASFDVSTLSERGILLVSHQKLARRTWQLIRSEKISWLWVSSSSQISLCHGKSYGRGLTSDKLLFWLFRTRRRQSGSLLTAREFLHLTFCLCSKHPSIQHPSIFWCLSASSGAGSQSSSEHVSLCCSGRSIMPACPDAL